jgi:hypothetical protein
LLFFDCVAHRLIHLSLYHTGYGTKFDKIAACLLFDFRQQLQVIFN